MLPVLDNFSKRMVSSNYPREGMSGKRVDDTRMPAVQTELPTKTLLRPGEVAAFLRVSQRTVYRWYDLGLIEGVRINKSLRIVRDSVVTLLQNSKTAR